MLDFATENNFDEKTLDNKITRDKSLTGLLKSLAIMAGHLKQSNTIWLSSDPSERCDRLKVLSQEKQAGNNS